MLNFFKCSKSKTYFGSRMAGKYNFMLRYIDEYLREELGNGNAVIVMPLKKNVSGYSFYKVDLKKINKLMKKNII